MENRSYVLVTPVHNEQATIEITIRAVLAQTIAPKEWIIVNDRSSDRTPEIVSQFTATQPFIRMINLQGQPEHSFAAVVRATEAGIKELRCRDYQYLGLLDADVRFAPDYYERLLAKFMENPRLGLGGGLVLDVGTAGHSKVYQNLLEVAGATQLFTKICFDSLGGLLPIPEGGWDAITCVRARMNGFDTRTFPDLVMDHLKPRNAAKGTWWQRNCQLGMRDYALGSHPLFEMAKCGSRIMESPAVAGSFARFWGYVQAACQKANRVVPQEVMTQIRREQLGRLAATLRLRPVSEN